VLTEKAFKTMIPLAARFNDGVATEIKKNALAWNTIQLGARAEYTFKSTPPRNGGESVAAGDFELERFLHLYALNRGVLLTPFHNMALMCPETTAADVDLHTGILGEAVRELAS
jgi:glutamate-1-semialdehyde 2,1-aminomutase